MIDDEMKFYMSTLHIDQYFYITLERKYVRHISFGTTWLRLLTKLGL